MTTRTFSRTVRRTAVVTVMALISAVGGSAVASESASPIPSPTNGPQSTAAVAAAEEEVYLLMEKEFEALRPAADALAEVRDAFPDDFAYSDFTETGFVVAFAGVAPKKALKILKEPGIPFELIENAGYSERQLEASLAEVTEDVRLQTKGKVAFEVTANPANGSIDVTLYDNNEAVSDSTFASVAKVKSRLKLKTDVKTAEGTISVSGYGRAGGTWLTDHVGGWCTSAFVVKSTSSDALGVLTAGHCPNSLLYYQPATGEAYWLQFRNERFGGSGDVQFNQSPVMMDAWFHSDIGVGRPVYDARDPLLNEFVCRFGMMSANMVCGAVTSVNTTVYYPKEGVTVTVAKMDAWLNHGDSGGPVFGGNTAMGVLSGGRFLANGEPIKGLGQAVYFTKIDTAEALTGTRVCLEPVCRW